MLSFFVLADLFLAPATCFDGTLNQNETDTDCGGVCGTTCIDSKVCEVNSDCLSHYCYQLQCGKCL